MMNVCNPDPTPENEISQSLLASAKAKVSDSVSMVGRRLVSEKEWHALQDEVCIQWLCDKSYITM